MTIKLQTIEQRINQFYFALHELALETLKFSNKVTFGQIMLYGMSKFIFNWDTTFPENHLEFCYEIEEYVDDLKQIELTMCQNSSFWNNGKACQQMLPPQNTRYFIKYFTPAMIDYFNQAGLSRNDYVIDMKKWHKTMKQLVHFHSLMKEMINAKNQDVRLSKCVKNNLLIIEIESTIFNPKTQRIVSKEKTQIPIKI